MSIQKMSDFLNQFRHKINQDTQVATDYYFNNINSFNENELKVIQSEIQDDIDYHFKDERQMSYYDVAKENELNIAYRLIKESFTNTTNFNNPIKKCNIENMKLNQFLKIFQDLKEMGYLNNSFEEIANILSSNFFYKKNSLTQKQIMNFYKSKTSTMKAINPISFD